MNSTEFTTELRKRLSLSKEETNRLLDDVAEIISEQLKQNNIVSLHNLGTLEVKKRAERISVNPSTGKRMLIPPKLVIGYKASASLKEKIKGGIDHE